MRAGLMRKRVTVVRSVDTVDSFGQVISGGGSTTTLGPYWCELKPLRGKSLEIARQLREDISHQITMRYFGAIYPTDNLQIDGRTFQVVETLNLDERNRTYQLLCTEVPSQGAPGSQL